MTLVCPTDVKADTNRSTARETVGESIRIIKLEDECLETDDKR
ncbi:hypothetical protein J2S71_000135 [Olsenella profusa DSM 13989]|nr:hypothetical protein [Olsenella profusa DSM 13989]